MNLNFDYHHIWHPYAKIQPDYPMLPVTSAEGVLLHLESGQSLIDGMSSWWAAIHGYNHPTLNQAIIDQTQKMAHVMFGGLTHEPAIMLAEKLLSIVPSELQHIFYADSGSVSVEVALKVAIQYQMARGKKQKTNFLTTRSGYHGDTWNAMSVSDPSNGLHFLFGQNLPKRYFADAPLTQFGTEWQPEDIISFQENIEKYHHVLAAVIIEPIVQGAGGMRIYHPEYLRMVSQLCKQYNVLLILDEIATGFGRTGKLFACEYSQIVPDIMCIGKALTGGYMTLAATLMKTDIAETISNSEPYALMHGPTFMANPLACAVANASIDVLLSTSWQNRILCIEQWLKKGLLPLKDWEQVEDVRILGAIGVVELKRVLNMSLVQKFCVEHSVWIRPFGKLVYLMPPFIINEHQIDQLINGVRGLIEYTMVDI